MEEKWENAIVLFKKAWVGKESLYSIIGYRNPKLLRVSNDNDTELWYEWEVDSDWR